MKRCFVGVVVVAVVCSVSAWGRDAKEDLKKMDGTWLATSAEQGGEKFPDEITKSIKLVIKDGKWTATVGDIVDKGTATVDTSKKPLEMDLMGSEGPNKDKKILCIYEVTDDTLKVAYDLAGKARPKEFKSNKDTKDVVITYKRQKT